MYICAEKYQNPPSCPVLSCLIYTRLRAPWAYVVRLFEAHQGTRCPLFLLHKHKIVELSASIFPVALYPCLMDAIIAVDQDTILAAAYTFPEFCLCSVCQPVMRRA